MTTAQAEAGRPPTAEELRAYAAAFLRDGYVLIPGVYRPAELAALADETEAQIAGGRREPIEHFGTRAMADGREVQMRVDWLIDKALHNHSVLAASAHPVVRAFVAEVFGVALFGMDSLVFKGPEGGPMVGMHSLRYHHRDLPADGHPEHANIGVYIDDAPEDGGCLEVVPGSHLLPYEEVERLQLLQFDAPGVVRLPARAGDVVVHSEFVIHGSKETGPSSTLRRVLYLSHHPAAQWGDRARNARQFVRMQWADHARAETPYAADEAPRPVWVPPEWEADVAAAASPFPGRSLTEG